MRRAFALVALCLGALLAGGPSHAEGEPAVYLPVVALSRAPVSNRGAGATYAANSGYERCAAMAELGLGWYYNWGSDPGVCPGVESVPWIWNDAVPATLGGNSRWTGLGNECANANQCNRTPQQMVDAWEIALERFPGRKWVVANSYYYDWAQEFLTLAPRTPDAIGVHCYMTQFGPWEGCKDHILRYIGLALNYGVPEVHITEFGYVPTEGEGPERAIEWMGEMIEWFESQPMITRYAWFQLSYAGSESWAFGVHRNTSLVDFETGAVTPFGEAYRLTPLWADARADVNGDKRVDIADLVIVGKSFGKPVR